MPGEAEAAVLGVQGPPVAERARPDLWRLLVVRRRWLAAAVWEADL
jgi:hypothetical protein